MFDVQKRCVSTDCLDCLDCHHHMHPHGLSDLPVNDIVFNKVLHALCAVILVIVVCIDSIVSVTVVA